jgi:aspartate-semialdehyde dehydrogenase
MKKYNIAVVGATGAVGEEMLILIKKFDLPVNKIVPLASKNSVGKVVEFDGKSIEVKELTQTVFEEEEIEIALFSAGGSISAKYAPYAVKAGAVVIDNTSHFRMQDDVPLVVPEVNSEDIKLWKQTGIIANPNCSTIQMVTALNHLKRDLEYKE